jgi:hypothetical protein
MRRIRTWAARAGIAMILVGVVAAAYVALTWKQQLIAWHIHECRRLSALSDDAELQEPSVFFHVLNRVSGFPGRGYFAPDYFGRLEYHFDALKKLKFLKADLLYLADVHANEFDGLPSIVAPRKRIFAYALLAPDGKGKGLFRTVDLVERIAVWEELASRRQNDEEER